MKKLFCLLLALLTIGGCALAETENKTDEAVLNVFTWEGYIDYSTVIKPFEEETGIKVNYATFSSNEEMYEKLSAVNGGDYDVVLASDYMLNTTREAGLMQPFDPAIVDNYSNLNAGFTHQFFDPDDQYVVPYVSGIPLIVYDPSAVEIDIKGFNDLWDPSLEDSLGLIDDARVTIGMVLLSMHQSMNTTDDAVLAEAAEKLDALRGNIHVLEYENLHNYLVSGDIAVAYTFTPFVALALDANPDLKVVWPEEGLGFGIDRCAMMLCGTDSIRDVILFPTMKPLDMPKKSEKAEEKTEETAPAAVKATGATGFVKPKGEHAAEEVDKVESEPIFEEQVDFDTFAKSDYRAVKIKECTAVPKSKKLLKFVLDDGSGKDRVILSGIHDYYEPEDLVGKTAIAIVNLPPRKMMGIDSCGMLISAVHHVDGEERLNFLMVDDDIPAGAKLY